MSESPSDWREYRRQRAFSLFKQGWRVTDIAQALGVTKGAVSQWLKKAQQYGIEALRTRKPPGAKPKLTREQRQQLPTLLAKGPEHYGFHGQVWTCARVVEVVKRTFGVTYHPAHMSRILKKLRLSPQKPITRATQRDEEAIAAWREERWPEIKKS